MGNGGNPPPRPQDTKGDGRLETMRRARRVVLWTILALVGLAAAIVGDAHRRASTTFERHEREVAELLREFRARSRERPSVYGESVPGNTWDHYAPVLADLKAMPEDFKDAIPEVNGEFDQLPDEEVLHDIYLRYAPQIEDLRRGLRSGRVDPAIDPSAGPEKSLRQFTDLLRTFRFLRGGISHEWRAGSDGAALELTVILLGLAHDSGRQGMISDFLVQILGEGIALDACLALMEGHSISPTVWMRFAAQLDELEESRPTLEPALRAEDIYRRGLILEGPIDKARSNPPETIGPGWRQLFSQRLMRAGALSETAEFFREMESCDRLPVRERRQRAASIGQHFRASGNPLALETISMLHKVVERDLIARMNLTLLRVAVALAWFEAETGQPPASLSDLVPRHLPAVPVCPLTGLPLGYAPGKVWSAGPDGKDDGGVLDPDDPTEPPRDGYDVVWRVRRRPP